MALFDRTQQTLTATEAAEVVSRLDDLRAGFIPHSRHWHIINAAMVEFLGLFLEDLARGEVEFVDRSPEAEGRPNPH